MGDPLGAASIRTLSLALALLMSPAAAFAGGDVTTRLTHNEIIIEGDGGNNAFDVKIGVDGMGNDVLVIEGRNDTMINGADRWEIPLNEGRTKFRNLTVEGGGGEDQITVDLSGQPEAKRFKSVEVEGGSGDDQVTVRNAHLDPKGSLSVNAKIGVDTVLVEDCDTTNLGIKPEDSGAVTVRRCNIDGKLNIDTGDGDAMVTIEDCFYGTARIRGTQRATVPPSLNGVIRRSSGKKVSLGGTSGNDNVVFEDNQIESVSVKLGDGDDLISFTGSSFAKTKLDGGGGTDCFDDLANANDFGSYKMKGFEPCDGEVMLEYFGLGADPIDEPPADAVAWRANNDEIGHDDGPYALPGAPNPLALPVLDPLLDVAPAHWADPDVCDWIHLHNSFAGHVDPAPGPPDTESACGHGALEWGRLVPAI